MSHAPSTLPAGWSKILDEIRQRLDLAVASADARLEQMPQLAPQSVSQPQQQDFAQLSERLQGLSDRLQAAEKVIQEVDSVLQAEENRVREHQAISRTLPQKLAAWAGRAIG